MPRIGARDMAKEHHWRGVLKDWQASALNGAEFCRSHEINYSQFKDWQKIIRRRDAETAVSTARKSGWPKGKPRKNAAKRVKQQSSISTRKIAFVAAKIKEPVVVSDSTRTAEMEIILRCGTVLRIDSNCEPNFLSMVVAALENR